MGVNSHPFSGDFIPVILGYRARDGWYAGSRVAGRTAENRRVLVPGSPALPRSCAGRAGTGTVLRAGGSIVTGSGRDDAERPTRRAGGRSTSARVPARCRPEPLVMDEAPHGDQYVLESEAACENL